MIKSELHLHCENGCEKAVFIEKDELYCIKCGGKVINVPDCDCLKYDVYKKQEVVMPYVVFYLENDLYKWSLISYNLQHCIQRYNSLKGEKIIVVGHITKGYYTIEEMKELEKIDMENLTC